jgi:hypothetical protein
MSDSTAYTLIDVPARIADLGFRVAVPSDWNSHALPEEDVDFTKPDAFLPLILVSAPWGAVVLTVAARPGFESGTLQDWSLYLLDAQGIKPSSFGFFPIGNLNGLAGVGHQEQEGTQLEIRFAFAEDGGRLVMLALMAPAAISASLEPVWNTALESFALARPQGQTVPLRQEEAATPSSEGFTESDLGSYAKADDTATLDPEHPVNARLRDQAVGFTPNLLAINAAAKTATVGAGALRAMIQVAYGWHVIDDGQRTMVLDPDGKIQINLSLIPTNGRNMDAILDEIQGEAEQSYPNPQFLRLQDGGLCGLHIRGIAVQGEDVEQLHMLHAWADESAVLRARVTADPASMRFAANYADLILKSATYGEASASS